MNDQPSFGSSSAPPSSNVHEFTTVVGEPSSTVSTADLILAGGDAAPNWPDEETPTVERKRGEPIGARARWKLLYDHLEKLGPGELFTYEEMGRMLSLDFMTQRNTIRSAFMRASKQLMEEHRRPVVVEHGLGFRVARPDDVMKLLAVQQKRAQVALVRGVRIVDTVNPEDLPEPTRKAFSVVGMAMRQQHETVRALDIRQTQLEQVVKMVATGQRQIQEESSQAFQALNARLEALENAVHRSASGA